MQANEGVWLSISDYSRYKNVSVSTIRRHIKNNILKHKEENGKYFIYLASTERLRVKEEEELLRLKLELELLRIEIKQLNEENSALKMLVDLYEKAGESAPASAQAIEQPPEIPFTL
jgi:cell shape-determining protein MreC